MGTHLLAIDWGNFLMRAYHSPGGRSTEAIATLIPRMIAKRIKRTGATHLVIAKDGERVFRYEEFPEYKAGRRGKNGPTPGELARAMQPHLDAWGVVSVEVEGFEADDVLATLARRCREANRRISILSRDHDLLATVGGTAQVLWPRPSGGEEDALDSDGVRAHTGVRPEQIRDWKTLAGDKSDGIPNVGITQTTAAGKRRMGITQKRAVELLAEHGTYDEVYARRALLPRREYDWLMACHDQALRMRELIRLRDDVEIAGLDPRATAIDHLRLAMPTTRQGTTTTAAG